MRTAAGGLAILLSSLLTGCGDGQQATISRLRFVNLVPNSTPFAVSRNEVPVEPLADGSSQVVFGAASTTLEVNPGPAAYRLTGTDGTVYFDGELPDVEGQLVSHRLIGLVDPGEGLPDVQLVAIPIDDTIAAGQAGLRFMHAIAGAGPLDVTYRAGGVDTPLGTKIAFGGVTGVDENGLSRPLSIPPGNGSIVARQTGTTVDAFGIVVSAAAGRVTNIAATGTVGNVGSAQW